MAECTVKHVSEIPYYEGPHAIEGIRFRGARDALGVTSWGMNVLDIDAGCTGYPKHDHTKDGQEEVYVVLSGSAVLIADSKKIPLKTGDMVRVPPAASRHFVTEEGVVLLALGGTPGAAYSVSA